MKRFLLFLPLLATTHLYGQASGGRHSGAKYAAARGDFKIGLAGTYLRPDYGQGVGYMFNPYVTLDLHKSYFGVELAGNITGHTKTNSKPNSATLGLRVGVDSGNARFYFKPAIGVGHFSGVTTAPTTASQTYLVYEIGGGVDYSLTAHLDGRLFGAYQIWPKFNGDTTAAFDHGGVLNPIFAGVGLAYRF